MLYKFIDFNILIYFFIYLFHINKGVYIYTFKKKKKKIYNLIMSLLIT